MKTSLKKFRSLLYIFIISLLFGMSTFIFYTFIQSNFYSSKADFNLILSQNLKTKYGDYNISFSDETGVFKKMFFKSSLSKLTIDSLDLEMSPSDYVNSFEWNRSKLASEEVFIEVSAKSKNPDINKILSTHLYFYEIEVNRFIEKRMISYFKVIHSNSLPNLIERKNKKDSLISYINHEIKEIEEPITISNIKYGLPIFDSGFNVLKEKFENLKIQTVSLKEEIRKSREFLNEFKECNCLVDVDFKGLVFNVFEIVENDEVLPKKGFKNGIIAFVSVFILGLFIIAFGKMVYIAND